MKKFFSLSFMFLMSVELIFAFSWSDLKPMDHLTYDEYKELLNNTPGIQNEDIAVGSKDLIILFVDKEPDYVVPKANSKSCRMVLLFGIPSAGVLLDALVVDSNGNDIFQWIRNNQFGFTNLVCDKNGNSFLVYASLYMENIGLYSLENYEVSACSLERSANCMFGDLHYYFHDSNSKKLFVLNLNGLELTESEIFMEYPCFYYSDTTRKSTYREILVAEWDFETDDTVLSPVYKCTGNQFVKIK